MERVHSVQETIKPVWSLPRHIVVKLLNSKEKGDILWVLRQKEQVALKGNNIFNNNALCQKINEEAFLRQSKVKKMSPKDFISRN